MALYTFTDILRHRRCPYEFRMDSRSSEWRITSEECVDMAVRDAVLASEQRRVMHGERIGRDEARSFFWIPGTATTRTFTRRLRTAAGSSATARGA